jgi:hypothetical protein
MKSAWLEPISSVVRVGACGAKHYDSYHLAATIRYIEIDAVEVVGLAKQGDEPGIRKTDWEAMVKCFQEAGIKRVLFRRLKNGHVREKWLEIKAGTGMLPPM